MKYSKYKYKYRFYLNANHSIIIEEKMGDIHPHTWEMTIDVIKIIDGFVEFGVIEKEVEQILRPYQDQYINEITPFDDVNPTLENLAEFFNKKIDSRLREKGWLLTKLEVAETPSRIYIIDNLGESI